MHTANITPFDSARSFHMAEDQVGESFRWIQAALSKARQDVDESLQRLRLRERMCRAELKDLYTELARCARRGMETVTLEVQIQRRLEESALCRQQAVVMSEHLEALSQRLDRTQQYACVN